MKPSTSAADSTLRSLLLRKLVLPAGDRVFGQSMMRRLRFLEEAQWWPRDRVFEWRDAQLRALVRVAYDEVPFYRELMRREAVSPEDIEGAGDLARLPVVTKGMLLPEYPHGTTRSTGQRTYEACTSGSTGANFRVREDSETFSMYTASFMLALEWAGWTMGEAHIQMGINQDRGLARRLKDLALQCRYVSAYDLRDDSLDSVLALMEHDDIRHLWGYPGSLYYLARRAEAVGWTSPLRSVVTWGDMLHPHYRSPIESVFRTRVFDTYGCGEGMQIAAQCGVGNGYHLHSLDVLVEHLDEAEKAVPAGQLGRVVVTRLHPGPMPLIRYDLGDVAVRGDEQPCSCGRGFERMGHIEGRNTDAIITPGGNRLIVHFFTGVLEYFREIEMFQVIQDRPGTIVVRIVPGLGFDDETRRAVIARLRDAGADLEIDVELVSEIPLTPGGKRRFVISSVHKDS